MYVHGVPPVQGRLTQTSTDSTLWVFKVMFDLGDHQLAIAATVKVEFFSKLQHPASLSSRSSPIT